MRNCSTCQFFQVYSPNYPMHGWCRFGAPERDPATDRAVWPVVLPDEWCGDHKPVLETAAETPLAEVDAAESWRSILVEDALEGRLSEPALKVLNTHQITTLGEVVDFLNQGGDAIAEPIRLQLAKALDLFLNPKNEGE